LVEIPKYDAITKRNRTANYATERSAATWFRTIANRETWSSQKYQTEMNQAIDKQGQCSDRGLERMRRSGDRWLSTRGNQARSGVEQNYQLELGANSQIYVSQVDAADQIRNAGMEAAKLDKPPL
jgi:hypothetical protein